MNPLWGINTIYGKRYWGRGEAFFPLTSSNLFLFCFVFYLLFYLYDHPEAWLILPKQELSILPREPFLSLHGAFQ